MEEVQVPVATTHPTPGMVSFGSYKSYTRYDEFC